MIDWHWLVERHVFASTMEDVHAKYEGLYANICDILGKLHVYGNISVSFFNQKVLDTALESWALALQESTNKNAETVNFEELNIIKMGQCCACLFNLCFCVSFDDKYIKPLL